MEKYYTEKGEFIKQLGYIACSISMSFTKNAYSYLKMRDGGHWKKGMGLEIVI